MCGAGLSNEMPSLSDDEAVAALPAPAHLRAPHAAKRKSAPHKRRADHDDDDIEFRTTGLTRKVCMTSFVFEEVSLTFPLSNRPRATRL